MLTKAATMELTAGEAGGFPTVTVKITNEGAHKLPSGYPEGRRIWINVQGYDEGMNLVYESGAYDTDTGILTHDADVKIYEIKPGISSRLSPIVGLPVEPSFHFVINDSIFSDNRIPPRGFTNANFEEIQSPPVAYAYADSQYWDETTYALPVSAVRADVALYYQSTSKEYIEFLRDENVTNSAGQDLYDAWVAHGRAAPVTMASGSIDLEPVTSVDPGVTPRRPTALGASVPSPFLATTEVGFWLSEKDHVRLGVYDASGRLVRTLVETELEPGEHSAVWDGRNTGGERVSSGTYFYRMEVDGYRATGKVILMR
jgi:hypothetical protein